MKKKRPLANAAGKREEYPESKPPVALFSTGLFESQFLHLLLLSVVALVTYSNTFHSPFVFDDVSFLDSPVIKDISTFLSGAGYTAIPRRFIGYLSFALNYKLGGLSVVGYHVVNLAVHMITSWLVYALVRLTLRTPFFKNWGSPHSLPFTLHSSPFLPLFAALLFVAHPIQTQAVTYIVQRLASLATLFYLLSLVCYIRARLSQEQASITGFRFPIPDPRSLYFILSLVAALLAMRTKEIAVTLPLVIALYEFSFFGSSARKKLLFSLPPFVISLIIPLGMLSTGKPWGELLSDVSSMARDSKIISRGDYLLTQFSVIATYIRLLLFPVNQNLDYDYPVYDSLFELPVLGGFILICSLIGLAIYLYYRTRPGSGIWDLGPVTGKAFSDPRSPIPDPRFYRLIAFGILWFFITLAVESSVIPITDVIFEHRLYLPSVGAFIALAAAGFIVARRVSAKVSVAFFATVVVVLAMTAWQRNLVWKDPIALWGDVVLKSPVKSRPNDNYGKALSDAGRKEEAIEFFTRAIAADPRNAYAQYNLGRLLDETNHIDESIGYYKSALKLQPDLVVARNNLAIDYMIKGQLDEAIEQYRIILKGKPDFAEAHNNIGVILKSKGEIDEAIDHYKAALKINSGNAKAYNNLGVAYMEKGLHAQAIEQFQSAVRLKPADEEYRENLARMRQGLNFVREKNK